MERCRTGSRHRGIAKSKECQATRGRQRYGSSCIDVMTCPREGPSVLCYVQDSPLRTRNLSLVWPIVVSQENLELCSVSRQLIEQKASCTS